jgi:hypothetical protein
LKKRTQCNKCRKVGHWEKEHPKPKHDVPKDEKKKNVIANVMNHKNE